MVCGSGLQVLNPGPKAGYLLMSDHFMYYKSPFLYPVSEFQDIVPFKDWFRGALNISLQRRFTQKMRLARFWFFKGCLERGIV